MKYTPSVLNTLCWQATNSVKKYEEYRQLALDWDSPAFKQIAVDYRLAAQQYADLLEYIWACS